MESTFDSAVKFQDASGFSLTSMELLCGPSPGVKAAYAALWIADQFELSIPIDGKPSLDTSPARLGAAANADQVLTNMLDGLLTYLQLRSACAASLIGKRTVFDVRLTMTNVPRIIKLDAQVGNDGAGVLKMVSNVSALK